MITLEHNIATMVEQGIIDQTIGIELANDPDDLLEALLADSAKEKKRREAKKERVDRQDFSDVGFDLGKAARRDQGKLQQQRRRHK